MTIYIKHMEQTQPTESALINKTGRAVIALMMMAFGAASAVWIYLYGNPANALHVTAQSWSYTMICVSGFALGLDAAVTQVIPLIWPKR